MDTMTDPHREYACARTCTPRRTARIRSSIRGSRAFSDEIRESGNGGEQRSPGRVCPL